MNRKQTIISIIAATSLGAFVAWAGAQQGLTLHGIPIFLLCAALAFGINWLVFLPAYFFQSEKFYDITGSITYITVTLLALVWSQKTDPRSLLLAALVMVWAARLGSFLLRRILRSGSDDRFDHLKPDFFRFLNAWTLQALWVIFTAAPAFIAITASKQVPLAGFAIVGGLVWLLGFGIEVLADHQKSKFRKDPNNKERFIQSGLWSRSRHPNYFGEIVLWLGVTIIAAPVLQGWQWIALISPVFVSLLLTKVSGVPMLEEKADKKWGGQEDYETYKESTPVLIPKL
ncbi:MAG: DUF1295 domain-containing protein [Bacteroidota bacterium]